MTRNAMSRFYLLTTAFHDAAKDHAKCRLRTSIYYISQNMNQSRPERGGGLLRWKVGNAVKGFTYCGNGIHIAA